MLRAVLVPVASVAMALPATAATKEEQRAKAVDFLAEAIAMDSVCSVLQLHMEYIWVELQQAKLNLDEILPEAGAKSAEYMPRYAQLGENEVCRLGAEYYGPRGSKARNMLTTQ